VASLRRSQLVSERAGPWLLLLTLAGAALVIAGLFVPYAHLEAGGAASVTLKRVQFDHFKESLWDGLLPLAVSLGAILAVTIGQSRSRMLASCSAWGRPLLSSTPPRSDRFWF
jgi:hypothetical protein